MPRTEVSILQGDTFVVSEETGDVLATRRQPLGLFHRDMRHLSRWQLRLNGRPLDVLSTSTPEYDEAMFLLVESVETPDETPPMSVVRRREVATGMVEELSVYNHAFEPVSFELSVLFDADFADIHQVKDRRSKNGTVYRRREGDRITLGRVGAFGPLLCGDRMFSGWGVRTVATGQLLYNPIEYHNGTVWPHDTAIAAAGAPLPLLRVLLGLEPTPGGLKMDPHLASGHGRLALYGLHFRGTRTHAVAGEEWV